MLRVPSFEPRKISSFDLLTTTACSRIPDTSSTSRASRSRRQPASTRSVVRDGIARILRHFACTSRPHERADRPPARGPAHPAVLRVRPPTSWGIGDIGDVAPVTAWLAGAGQRVLQLLPLNEMAPGQQSPYSAISAMAIDPIFIRVPDVPEFARARRRSGADAGRSRGARARPRARRASTTRRSARLKTRALRAAFERFLDGEWRRDTPRARTLRAFVSEQAWWIEDYALFRAIHAREDERPWTEWPDALQRREPPAIDRARRELRRRGRCSISTCSGSPTRSGSARATAHARRRAVRRSAVHGRRRQRRRLGPAAQFRLDVSLGVPPDAFSATGQDWGMPVYDGT